MEELFTWRTLNQNDILCKSVFSYGKHVESKSISEWNPVLQDLKIITDLSVIPNIDIREFLYEDEVACWIINWNCDGKFTGTSAMCPYSNGETSRVECSIPAGMSSIKVDITCHLVACPKSFETDGGDWNRPPGSILASRPLIESAKLTLGGLFPLKNEYRDSNELLRWVYFNLDDLELSVPYSLCIYLNLQHPLAKDYKSNKTVRTLILLMIIQDFVAKGLTDQVFSAIKSCETEGGTWSSGSLGSAFLNILEKIAANEGYASIDGIKEVHSVAPEQINVMILKLFAKSLLSH
jgi:hypothetical protein